LPSQPPRCCGGSTAWCGGASAPTWAGRRFGGRLSRPLLFVYLDYFIGYSHNYVYGLVSSGMIWFSPSLLYWR
jgi:hypothetical protein